jgi:hypothetical protein
MRMTLGALLLLSATGVFAHGPHEHGVVKLDVAVEPGRVTLLMESPLANLVGFERAPRSDAERQRVDAALNILNAAATLFNIDPAAGCTPGPVELNAAALEDGKPGAASAEAGHADLDASFSFKCRKVVPAFVDIGLFAAFPGVQRIDVQLITGNAQSKRTLTRPTARLSLTR